MDKLTRLFFLVGVVFLAQSFIGVRVTKAKDAPPPIHTSSLPVSETFINQDAPIDIQISPIPVRNTVDLVVAIEAFGKQGSGVLVGRVGDTYSVLTCAHVVHNLIGQQLRIVMFDGNVEVAKVSNVKFPSKESDLSIVTFNSHKNYRVAEIGNSSVLTRKQKVYAIGFVGNALMFEPGRIVAASTHSQQDGYQIAIGQANITAGMSGGGLFDLHGRLIGIPGKSIGADPTDLTKFRPVSGLAIPIDIFKRIVNPKLPVKSDESNFKTSDDFFVAAGHAAAKGDYQLSVLNYTRALTIDPDLNEAYFRRGLSRMVVRDWKNAEKDLEKSIDSNTNYAEAYSYRARVRTVLGNSQGADADFHLAKNLTSNFLKVNNNTRISTKTPTGFFMRPSLFQHHSWLQPIDRVSSQPQQTKLYGRGFGYTGRIDEELRHWQFDRSVPFY